MDLYLDLLAKILVKQVLHFVQPLKKLLLRRAKRAAGFSGERHARPAFDDNHQIHKT